MGGDRIPEEGHVRGWSGNVEGWDGIRWALFVGDNTASRPKQR
jgi:hypothetical protein